MPGQKAGWKKGVKTGGRQKGTPNKTTSFFREALTVAYQGIGGHAEFIKWARGNPGEFYKLCARLIPAERTTILMTGGTIMAGPSDDDTNANGLIEARRND